VLYVAVTLVVTGMQHYTEMSATAPLADAFKSVNQPFFSGAISLGAIVGLITVCMILLLGQTRVFFAMSRDGLLPRFFSITHPKYRTPYWRSASSSSAAPGPTCTGPSAPRGCR
jgi:APA family basic amino acid/polyamine antiporter